ncbi:hypothetical protein, partial [Mailhella sp.]
MLVRFIKKSLQRGSIGESTAGMIRHCGPLRNLFTKRDRVSASLVPLRASIFHFLTQYTETQKKLPKDIHFVDGKRDALIFCVL